MFNLNGCLYWNESDQSSLLKKREHPFSIDAQKNPNLSWSQNTLNLNYLTLQTFPSMPYYYFTSFMNFEKKCSRARHRSQGLRIAKVPGIASSRFHLVDFWQVLNARKLPFQLWGMFATDGLAYFSSVLRMHIILFV